MDDTRIYFLTRLQLLKEAFQRRADECEAIAKTGRGMTNGWEGEAEGWQGAAREVERMIKNEQ